MDSAPPIWVPLYCTKRSWDRVRTLSPDAQEMQPVPCDGRIMEPSVSFRWLIGTLQRATVPWFVSRDWMAEREHSCSNLMIFREKKRKKKKKNYNDESAEREAAGLLAAETESRGRWWRGLA